MRLRDRDALKTPQRYDNVDYEDRHLNEARQQSGEPESLNAYRGPVIEYNPNLRPAVFPTIPLDQEVDESLFTPPEVNLQNAPLQHPQRATRTSQPEDVGSSHQSDASSHTLRASPSSDSEMFSFSSTDDRWSRELNRDINTSPLGPSSPKMPAKPDVGIGSKVWNDNMKKLDKLSKRTETDWNIAEMETSEEDEAEEIKTQAQHSPKDFAWDCLAVVQRLCIVDAIDESCNDLDATFKALRLTTKQKDDTIALIAQRNEYIDAEEAALELVRNRASEILSSGNQEDIDWLTKKGGYGKLMAENVYIGTQYFDYMTTTSGELQLAKRYLMKCGLEPELLDHWASVDTLNLGNPSSSSTSKEPAAAAFPTIPHDQVSQEQPGDDDPSVALQHKPVAELPEEGLRRLSLIQQQVEEPTGKKIKRSGTDSDSQALPQGRHPSAAMFPKPKSRAKKRNRRQTPASDNKNKTDQGMRQQHDTFGFSQDKNNTGQGPLSQHGIDGSSFANNETDQGFPPQHDMHPLPLSFSNNDTDQGFSRQEDVDYLMD